MKAPGFGDRRKAMLEDMAVLTAGTFISEDLGIKLEGVTPAQMGTAKRVVVSKDETTIVEGAGSADAIRGRIGQLRRQIETTVIIVVEKHGLDSRGLGFYYPALIVQVGYQLPASRCGPRDGVAGRVEDIGIDAAIDRDRVGSSLEAERVVCFCQRDRS